MKIVFRTISLFTLMLAATAAAAEPIAQRLVFALNGSPSEFIAGVREGVALQGKINPGVGHELWMPISAGSDRGASLIVYYDSAEQYADAIAREDANEEWRAFLARFPADKFPVVFSGLSVGVIRPNLQLAKGGEVQSVLAFELQGPMEDLVAQVSKGIELQKSINPGATVALVAPFMSGEAVNRAAVLTRYANIKEWAQARSKMQNSREWSAFIEAFPEETYPVRYQALAQAVNIH